VNRLVPFLLFLGSCLNAERLSADFAEEVANGVVSIERTVERYYLHGSTGHDLTLDLASKRTAGERFTGWTRWRTRWTFQPVHTERGCEVGPVDVQLLITQVLPGWHTPDDADPEFLMRWRDYLDALEEHENHHAHLAESAAQRIQATLQSLPARASCEQMRHEANRVGHQQVEDLRRANHLYDDVTGHGATQGAIFPASGALARADTES
jgi:predicted secreted Zn-dependent protease